MNRSTLERLAPLTGVAFVALFIASFIVLGETPDIDDPVDEVVGFWQDHETEGQVAGGLLLWGAVLAVWFGASVRTALRRAEGEPGRLAAIALAGWVIFAVGACSFAGFNFTAADAADEANVSGQAIQTISILGEDFFAILTAGLALAMLATGVATLRFGGLPRWLGYVALLLGVAAVTPAGFFSFMLAGVWVIVVSVLLYQQGAEAPAPGGG